MQALLGVLTQMSGWEMVATLFGIIYVVLAAKESRWAWFFTFFSTLVYTVIFWDGALIASSFLNFYYMAMSIYAFMLWGEGEEGEIVRIGAWSLRCHVLFILFGSIITVILGYLTSTYAGARFAYHDAFVMVFSGIATWMMAKKVLENWLYWIVVDSTAAVLYFKSGYLATIVLFVLYVILAFYGYVSWRKRSLRQKIFSKSHC